MFIGNDTKIEDIVVSPGNLYTARGEAEGCGEIPRPLLKSQWPKSRYQFSLFRDNTQ